MILTITECSMNIKKLDINFYGNKDDLMQCICLLIKVYFKEYVESK